MANKKEREKRMREDLLAKYKNSRKNNLSLYVWAIAVLVAAILCYLLNWVYVDNSDFGIEVKASGLSFIAAALTGKYSSTSAIYGDLAVPFYYYGAESCKTLGALTLAAIALNFASAAVLIVTRATKLQELSIISVLTTIASCVLLFAAFVVALNMKNDKILSTYCGGNPKCSIGSFALVAALVTGIAAAMQIISLTKLFVIKREYKAKRSAL